MSKWVLHFLPTNPTGHFFCWEALPHRNFNTPYCRVDPALSVGEEDASCTGQAASWTLPWWLEPVSRWLRITHWIKVLWPGSFFNQGPGFRPTYNVMWMWVNFLSLQISGSRNTSSSTFESGLLKIIKQNQVLTWDNLFWCLWLTDLLNLFFEKNIFSFHSSGIFWVTILEFDSHLAGPASATSFSSWQMRFGFFQMITYLYICTWTTELLKNKWWFNDPWPS